MLPIELKTGKMRQSTVSAHRAQVMLYVLMLMVRHCQQVQARARDQPAPVAEQGCPLMRGLLFYLGGDRDASVFEVVELKWSEVTD